MIIFFGLSAFNKNKIGLKNIPPPIPTIPEINPSKDPMITEIKILSFLTVTSLFSYALLFINNKLPATDKIKNNKIDNVIDIFKNREIVGEITIVIKGLEKSNLVELDESKLKQELKELINAGLSLPAASKYLAKKKNLKKI